VILLTRVNYLEVAEHFILEKHKTARPIFEGSFAVGGVKTLCASGVKKGAVV